MMLLGSPGAEPVAGSKRRRAIVGAPGERLLTHWGCLLNWPLSFCPVLPCPALEAPASLAEIVRSFQNALRDDTCEVGIMVSTGPIALLDEEPSRASLFGTWAIVFPSDVPPSLNVSSSLAISRTCAFTQARRGLSIVYFPRGPLAPQPQYCKFRGPAHDPRR